MYFYVIGLKLFIYLDYCGAFESGVLQVGG